jgi:hypothetical protein
VNNQAVSSTAGTGLGQRIERAPSKGELAFMNDVAIPKLDKVEDNDILQGLADNFWQLCLWENDRAKTLDSKASSLLGLSSIAAAVVAVAGESATPGPTALFLARCLSLVLFTATVAVCVLALRLRAYGGFNDEDMFASVCAHEAPIGDVKPFQDKDETRCFLKETILQRWLIYRWHSDENDRKAGRVVTAQTMAFLAVASLFGYIVVVLAGL